MGQVAYLGSQTSYKLESIKSEFKKYLLEIDRGKSVISYIGDINKFTDWFSEENILATSPLDIVEYRRYLQEHGGRKNKPAAPATVNRALISLKIFFEWLVKVGCIKDNPVKDIKQVATSSRPAPKWLSRSQQIMLMRAVREKGSVRDEAMIGVMLHAGLRISEVCALQREDIHISERVGKAVVRQGKGNKYREVPLNKTIRKILSRWLEQNPEGVLWPNRRGGQAITTRGAIGMVVEYARRANLPGVTPHTFRHTFCKNAIDLGTPIDQVAVMAGHTSLDITKRYTAPSQEDLQTAVEKMAWE